MRFVNNVPNNTSNNETSHQSYISKIFVFKAFVRKLTKGFIIKLSCCGLPHFEHSVGESIIF